MAWTHNRDTYIIPKRNLSELNSVLHQLFPYGINRFSRNSLLCGKHSFQVSSIVVDTFIL